MKPKVKKIYGKEIDYLIKVLEERLNSVNDAEERELIERLIARFKYTRDINA